MIAQLTSRDFLPQLCPQLRTVLSSLGVNLDSELNRYRRDRHHYNQLEANLFDEIDDASFDLAAVESAVEASIATVSAIARSTPPSLPPNKKLLLGSASQESRDAEPNRGLALSPPKLTPQSASSSLAFAEAQPNDFENGSLAERVDKETHSLASPGKNDIGKNDIGTIASGYLASSEKLIESLAQVSPMPEPIDAIAKPRHKTVSLLAGAALGFLGLVTGLGASYLMANPLVAQRIADQFRLHPAELTATQIKAFDPLGPDLSANEFINLKLNNLSSLAMPQAELTPAANVPANLAQTEGSSSTTTDLPPTQSTSAVSPLPPSAAPTLALAPPSGTQAVVIPTGLTYYVTTPFASEQGLATIRETISEAFVRRFSDGNRIQIAAFDNPQAAQSFIAELSTKGIAAQIYGPTTE
ncbi:MAG: SPOR domain-containing protein [Phormidesmis sp.]